MSSIEVRDILTIEEIDGFCRRAKKFPGFKKAGKDLQTIELKKFPKSYKAFGLVDGMMHIVVGSWGNSPVDEEALLNRFTLDFPVSIDSRYFYKTSFSVSIICGHRLSVFFSSVSSDLRQELLEEIVGLPWFCGKFRVEETPQGHLVTPKEGIDNALTMDGRSASELRALVQEGNLFYWSLQDRFIVQGGGMGVREQLDFRSKMEGSFLKESRVERSLSSAPKTEEALRAFQAQLDPSMASWDWNIQLMAMSKINLKNFKQFAAESGEFYALLFTIKNKRYGEIDCYVTYEDGKFEISLLAEPEEDDVEEHCIEVLNKLTGKSSAWAVEL